MGSLELIGAAWSGGFFAVRRNGPLFAATFLVMLVIAAVFQPYLPVYHHAAHSVPHHIKPVDLHIFLLETLQNILMSIAATPAMIAVHRFVLLKEAGKALSSLSRLVFFAIWITTFHFLLSVPVALQGRAALIGFALYCFAVYGAVRLVMSFPAVALDIQNPLRYSWSLARGHWWQVFWAMVLGFLPLFCGVVPLFIASGQVARILFVAILNALYPVVGAALASVLYRSSGGLIRRQDV